MATHKLNEAQLYNFMQVWFILQDIDKNSSNNYISVRIVYSKKTPMLFNMNLLIRFTIKHASIWICANNDPVEVFLRLFSSRLKIIIPLLSMIYQQRRIYSVGSEIKIQFILNVLNPYYELQPNKKFKCITST